MRQLWEGCTVMSFPALYLACQALNCLPTLEDDEFGVSWEDLEIGGLDIEWVIYRSGGVGFIFGVRNVTLEPPT